MSTLIGRPPLPHGGPLTTTDHHILQLRARGMSYNAIALAINHFTDEWISEYDARSRARRMGAPRDTKRART